jgi:hypothetical protein
MLFGRKPRIWLKEVRDERELTRLELVGLAAEIAAVAAHRESRLLPPGQSRYSDKLRGRCQFFLRAADEVLSRDARLEDMSTAELEQAVVAYRGLQRKLGSLRGGSDFATDTMLG